MHENDGRAVGRERVVELRLPAYVVHSFDIVEKNTADVPERRARAVNVNVFLRLPIGCADADHVALVGSDVNQLVLAKESGEGRAILALLLEYAYPPIRKFSPTGVLANALGSRSWA